MGENVQLHTGIYGLHCYLNFKRIPHLKSVYLIGLGRIIMQSKSSKCSLHVDYLKEILLKSK